MNIIKLVLACSPVVCDGLDLGADYLPAGMDTALHLRDFVTTVISLWLVRRYTARR